MTRATIAMLITLLAACGGHHAGDGDGSAGGSGDGSGSGSGPGTISISCPSCPGFPGTGSDAPPPCAGSASSPLLVYPPDQVLLPPNMNVIDAHFRPGDANTIFEIDFTNAVTDVRLETRCNAITDTRGNATGGCDFSLDAADWGDISQQNRGGDPLTVTVRAAPEDLSCVSASNSRQISFAEEDMKGGIYYWQSVTQNGVAGTTGGIFRKDFGDPTTPAEAFLTPGNLNKCVGCHFVSRDGLKLIYGSDDADSDDELGDMHGVLYDITGRTGTTLMNVKGFQTFVGTDHDDFLSSDGEGKAKSPGFVELDGTTGMGSGSAAFTGVAALTGLRVTHPDWSRDGTKVYFTAGTAVTATGYNRVDDTHLTNGAIWSVDYDATTHAFANAQELVTPPNVDENDYYPTISPDGTSLIFDRAVGTTLETHDSYNNPTATLFGLPAAGGTPVELARANYKAGMTNSWPRWSPFVQSYRGKHILWVTFSSTRDYGLRVENEAPPSGPTVNCYPPVSPEDTSGDHAKPFAANCTQPQIWMAAITLEDLAAGQDGSFPAFWLPFQDDTAHNHIAQWVDAIAPGQTDCPETNQSCATTACCTGLDCDATSKTCQPVIF